MYETFIDLDELIVRCRDKQAKKFIQEAVTCYRAGAFRSCIVATWNAVVFDFLHKLRELELLGNGEASSLLQKFENFRETENVKELWQFESNIPKVALREFELISPVEQTDIERLLKDRSRCAHPSMTSVEEPFEATAELARYHLRSAVIHLLQRPPVQGRSALNRIWNDIKSEYFPSEIESAIIVLQKGPLARAKFSVIKDIILGLNEVGSRKSEVGSKFSEGDLTPTENLPVIEPGDLNPRSLLTANLLTDERPEDERKRQFSALNAVSKMYPKEAGEILNDKLSDFILNKIVDANWDKVIIYLGSTTAWESLSESCQIKARVFIDKLDIYEHSGQGSKHILHTSINLLVKAARLDFLKNVVINKFQQIPLTHLLSVRNICQDNLFKQNVINHVLKNMIPQAELYQLISMRSDSDETLNQLIEPHLKEKIEESYLDDLLPLIGKYNNNEYIKQLIESLIKPRLKEEIQAFSLENLLSAILKYNNEYLNQLLEPYIKDIITKSPWKELISVKCKFKDEFTEVDQPLIELIDNGIDELIKEVPFKELVELVMSFKLKSSDPLVDKYIKPLLNENFSEVIDIFIESSSWSTAQFSANLIVEIVDILTTGHWNCILDAFCTNNQIYSCPYSPSIASIFISLFNNSVKINGTVQPYWLDFRKKLNIFTRNKDINQLKLAIDSTQF